MDFFIIFSILLIAASRLSQNDATSLDVTKFGAIGDGSTDNTNAFEKAWDAACTAGSKVELIVPKGKTFLVKPILFKGPCKSSSIQFVVQGTIVAPETKREWNAVPSEWIRFLNVNGLEFGGQGGVIDGQGASWWNECKNGIGCENHPTALAFHNCQELRIHSTKHINSPRNHISINGCKNSVISDLHIIAPADSPNTDGIDISSSQHVQISDSVIATGDDCIAINGGVSFLDISGITCGPGHGISIGSLGGSGKPEIVEEVHVKHCILHDTQNGLRIKSWQGGSGYARKISFKDVILHSVGNPIVIDQFYCPHGKCHKEASYVAAKNRKANMGKIDAVKVSDIEYSGIQGTTTSVSPISLKCSHTCDNILLEHINIKPTHPLNPFNPLCENVRAKQIDVHPSVKC